MGAMPPVLENIVAAEAQGADRVPLSALVSAMQQIDQYTNADGTLPSDKLADAFRDGFRAALQTIVWEYGHCESAHP